MLHVKNKQYLLLPFLLFLVVSQVPNQCLLEEPLTNQCLNSISTKDLDKEVTPYLCVITLERSLLIKAQEICKQAYLFDVQSGYRYLRVLLRLHKFEKAFRTQYTLFFTNPFQHNRKVMQVINQSQTIFNQLSSNGQKVKDTLTVFDKAIFDFYNNKVEQSLKLLQLHISQQPQNATLIYEHFLMFRIFQVQLQYYQGLNYLNELIKKNGITHGYLWHLHGNFLMHHLQFEKAIKSFEKANKWFDQSYNTNGFSFTDYNIGLCYQKLNKVQEAIKYYEKSIIKLSSPQALNALGHAHYTLFQKNQDQKEIGLAQKYYKKSIELNPQYTIVLFNLGMLEISKKNPKAAQQYFQKCLTASQTFNSCKYGLIKTYYYLNQTAQVDLLLSTIQLSQETIAELLAIFYQLGDHKKALSLVGQREDFKFSGVFEWKGFNEYELGLYEQAQKSFKKAIFLGAKKGYIYYSLGLAELELKKYNECYKSFDTAYRMDSEELAKNKSEECKKKLTNNEL